jgi:hypothetical protein
LGIDVEISLGKAHNPARAHDFGDKLNMAVSASLNFDR